MIIKGNLRVFLGAVALLSAVTCLSLTVPCQAQQTQQSSSAAATRREVWRKSMKEAPPSEKGCFKASYPSTTWQEAACAPPPSVHSLPPRVAGPDVVGNGYDFAASASGAISSATGSFPVVVGLESANSYSLQLNTNFFNASACSGAANPSACRGWVQFVFNESTLQVYLEYTLINWGSTHCPAGWGNYTLQSEINCYINTTAVGVPDQPLSYLPYMELTGKTSGGSNTAILSTLDGNVSAVVQDGLLGDNLTEYWDEAEFNVFGDDNDAEVNFNPGTAFVVQTSVNNGTTHAPVCVGPKNGGTTGETNNLSLVPASAPLCCPYSGSAPSIQFLEGNLTGATATCGVSALQPTFPQQTTSLSDFSWTQQSDPTFSVQVNAQQGGYAYNGSVTFSYKPEYSGSWTTICTTSVNPYGVTSCQNDVHTETSQIYTIQASYSGSSNFGSSLTQSTAVGSGAGYFGPPE